MENGAGAGSAQVPAQPVGAGGSGEAAKGGAQAATTGEHRIEPSLARWRSLFHDVPDDLFEGIIRSLQVPESISGIARKLIEEGYLADLHPTTVRMHLTRFRDAMGWPKYADAQAQEPPARIDKLDAAGELVEALPPMKRLSWLIRIQQARVRKALRFEGQMAGMILPMASQEIKLLSDLLDKELTVAMKTGDIKTAPQTVTLEGTGLPITDPASAYRVVLALRRVRAALLAENAAPDGEPGHPAAAGAAASDGRVDDGGGDAGGTPLPGAAASGPVGPGPGADGAHGRT